MKKVYNFSAKISNDSREWNKMEFDPIHRREKIILHAIDLIHENGICAVSTKEIAKRLGISEGTVFKCFPKKKDLLMAVLEQFCMYDEDIFHTAKKVQDPHKAIPFFIDCYMSYYENYPAITSVLHAYEALRGNLELEEKLKSIFFNRLQFIKTLIEGAQKEGFIRKDIDSEILADIIHSTCRGMCLKWRMQNLNSSLREKTMVRVNEILNAFCSQSNEIKLE